MTRGIARLGAAVVVVAALMVASAAWAWPPASRTTVELETEACTGPVAAVLSGEDGAVVFHGLNAGRYVIALPQDAGRMTVTVVEGGVGRTISGKLSPVTNGRRYAVGADGSKIVVAVASGGQVRLRLDGL